MFYPLWGKEPSRWRDANFGCATKQPERMDYHLAERPDREAWQRSGRGGMRRDLRGWIRPRALKLTRSRPSPAKKPPRAALGAIEARDCVRRELARAPVAQWIERRASNAKVGSSILSGRAKAIVATMLTAVMIVAWGE
jgi:hypothetical protein